LVLLSQLYLNAEVPYPAAKTLEKGFKDEIVEDDSKNYELAGVAWRQAQEVNEESSDARACCRKI
jgi:hypothetical protein